MGSQGGSIAVTTADVRALGDKCTSTGGAIGTELNALLGQVNSVVNGSWVGQAAGSFDAYFQEAKRGFDQVQQALDGMNQQLKGAATAYDDTEQGIAGGFQRG